MKTESQGHVKWLGCAKTASRCTAPEKLGALKLQLTHTSSVQEFFDFAGLDHWFEFLRSGNMGVVGKYLADLCLH